MASLPLYMNGPKKKASLVITRRSPDTQVDPSSRPGNRGRRTSDIPFSVSPHFCDFLRTLRHLSCEGFWGAPQTFGSASWKVG
jgi:hypothetical protein